MRKHLMLTTVTALVTGLAASPAIAETVLPAADTFFDASSQAAPMPTNGVKTNLTIQGSYQALLRFDPKSLPGELNSQQIQRATLNFWVSALVNGPATLNLTDMAPTSGNGNWSETDPGFVQSIYAASYAPAVESIIDPVTVTDKGRWYSVDVTKQVVGWLISPNVNSIQIANADPNSTAIVQIDSKENGSTSHPAFIDISLAVPGPQGQAGTPGVSGYQVVSVTSPPQANIGPGGFGGWQIVCPGAKVPLGGGCAVSDARFSVYHDTPLLDGNGNSVGWACGWRNNTQDVIQIVTLTTHIICANVQ